MSGRKQPTIVTDTFTVLEKKKDKSGDHIQNRDNNHIKHLADPKKCPNASSDIRKQALTFLAGKNAAESLIMTAGSTSDATFVPIKKRRSGTLAGMVDYPLLEEQQKRANMKLFRFVVHANVAFSIAENWFF
ncbi:hypothetical protein BU17DRAFT_88215 [Hysterangium stoloniferum]|nr:hypothetical protein BU17DRAFT_88215 [Hysterangium stoloniferum]